MVVKGMDSPGGGLAGGHGTSRWPDWWEGGGRSAGVVQSWPGWSGNRGPDEAQWGLDGTFMGTLHLTCSHLLPPN